MLRNASKKYSETAWWKKINFFHLIIFFVSAEVVWTPKPGIYICGQNADFLWATALVGANMRSGKLEVALGCKQEGAAGVKIYKGQIYIKYDARNTYI